MIETTRLNDQDVAMEPKALAMALELSSSQWRVAFTTGVGQRPRRRLVRREQWGRLADEIATAKARFHLPADAPVVSCYEAGPDGFWVHRFLTALGVTNLVVDSASIEVSRRARHAKTDRLDVERLLGLVLRYVGGERSALRVVHVPAEADEHRRQLHRELLTLTQDRVRVTNRIRGLLLTLGIHAPIGKQFGRTMKRLQQWNGDPLPTPVRMRLEREWAHVELLTKQMKALVAERHAIVCEASAGLGEQVRRLARLRGVGEHSAWVFAAEFFAWRQLRNRRQVGAIAGLVPTPHQSGALEWEQGISKAGNRHVRALAIQIAWSWVRRQPHSALTQWFQSRFGDGGPRARKIGIVAVARRLLIALWRYVDAGVMPEGATLAVKRGAPPLVAA